MPVEGQKIEKDQIEVKESVLKKGTVNFMTADGFSNPAPQMLKRILTGMRYTFTGMITLVAGTDLFTGYQSKLICLILSGLILLTGGIEISTGVKPLPDVKGGE